MAKRSKKKKRNAPETTRIVEPRTKPPGAHGKLVLLQALGLLAAVILAYQPAWNGTPLWDDNAHLTQPALRSWQGLIQIWTTPGATQQYYPLVHSLFWVEYWLWGDAFLGYHLVNILLHGISALLLIRILQRLEIPGAWLIGALFALHPVQVESVAWMTELKNMLSGVFYFASALVYLKFDRTRNRAAYATALILFVVGLLAKTVIATLPGALLVIFWWKRGKLSWKQDVTPLVPFFAVGLAAGLVTSWVERKFVGAEGPDFNFSFIERGLIAGRVIWFYLGKLFWPADLVFIYPHWDVSGNVGWQYLFPGAVVVLLVALWWLSRWWRGPLAGLLFFIGTLFPVLGFFNVYPFCYSFVADHFQYLACIGPLTLAGVGITRVLGYFEQGKPWLKPLVYGTLLTTLGVLSWNQAQMYGDVETLWRTTISRNPTCWLAYNELGGVLSQTGRMPEAMAQYEETLKLKPEFAEVHYNMGFALAQVGQIPEAIEQYEQALRIKPDLAEAHNGLGLCLRKSGRASEAIQQYQEALRLKPDYADAHNNMGNALAMAGRAPEAIGQYEEVLRINPDDAMAHSNLGNALLMVGRVEEAIQQCSQALQLKPDYADAHNNLGNALLRVGRAPEAIGQYEEALRLNPDDYMAHNNLGVVLAQIGRVPEAIQQYQEALRLKPDFVNARNNLARAQALEKAAPVKK